MHIQKALILNSINIQVKLIEIDTGNTLSIITLITQCFEKLTQTHSAGKSYLRIKCDNFCPPFLHLSHISKAVDVD